MNVRGATVAIVSLFSVGTAAPNVAAQCGVWQESFGSFPGTSGPVRALVAWDADGVGAMPPVLVAGGSFVLAGGQPAQNVAMWDGETWSALGGGLAGEVLAVVEWDPDAVGPAQSRLVAGGTFTSSGTTQLNRIAFWDGVNWQPLGTGMNGEVWALASWDPDGLGPQLPQLIAGGLFSQAGAIGAQSLASWSGQSWSTLGGINGVGYAATLTAWDADGVGPNPAVLVVGGSFSSIGGIAASNIAIRSNTGWQALGQGPNNLVLTVIGFDADGDGSEPSELIAGGIFDTVGSVGGSGLKIGAWNGQSWRSLGSANSNITNLIVFDADGDGLLAPNLVAVGSFSLVNGQVADGVASWDGLQWSGLASAPQSDLPQVQCSAVFDPDASGPLPPELVVGGTSLVYSVGFPVRNIMRLVGATWKNVGSGLNEMVRAVSLWDSDGAGPLPSQLVAGGAFDGAGNDVPSLVARWTGTAFQPIGDRFSGANLGVSAVMPWNHDGHSATADRLLVSGSFSSIGSLMAANIATWDGSEWLTLGSGLNSLVSVLTEWDHDASTSTPRQIVAGGHFTGSGNVPLQFVARWDGQTWHPLGAGVTAAVWAATPIDMDGSGPLSETLFVGGLFDSAGGIAAARIASWNGQAWSPLAGGVNGDVLALSVWDSDGEGPTLPVLAAGGRFTRASGVQVNRIARWNGQTWSGFGLGLGGTIPSSVSALATRVVTGERRMIAAGRFSTSSGPPLNNVAEWNGSAWLPLSTGVDGDVVSIAVDANAYEEEDRVILGGYFVQSSAGSGYLFDYIPCASPRCDSVDFNNDGSLFDPQDIDAYLSVFSEGSCIPVSANCSDVDFNNDGSLFDPCDIDSFLLVFSEGPCTLCGS